MATYNIAIIGAGPAGMMAAIRAAHLTSDIALFEKNASCGRKLGLTGKGRCNLTNDALLEVFLEKFGRQGAFLRNAFGRFFAPELKDYFLKRGLKLKTERQGRVFPATDTSASVLEIFQRDLKQLGVDVHLSLTVKQILPQDGEFSIKFSDGQEVRAKKVVLATGGVSYPQTGSTGEGFQMARAIGHNIIEFKPGLVALETEESFVKELQGLTLTNIRVVFTSGKKEIESSVGELLFTHFGISGPLVLDLSFEVAGLLQGKNKVRAGIDLKPALSAKHLEQELQHDLQKSGPVKLKNYLTGLLPKRFVPVFIKICSLDGDKKCHQVSAIERKRMVDALKNFPLMVKNTRPLEEAMVTHGGVSLKEIDPRTMESRKVQGLYFCGEALDVAAPSGGYNLQAAFSTGYLAGESAARSLTL